MAEKKVIVSFNRAPYGTIFYTEGLRAAVGTTAGIDEHKVDCVFLGEGVYFTGKDVERIDSAKYIATLSSLGAKLYAEEESLSQRSLKKEDLADDIVIIPRSKVLELYSDADMNIDF